MHTAANRKRIGLYSVCVCFFCLAGVFQAVDATLPEFFHALFACAAHTILISLVVAWGVSLVHRMVRRDLRAYFLTVAALILFFLVVRMIKYGLTKDTDTLSRYLWYAYYIPQCLIPPTILLAALRLENRNGKPQAGAWYLLYLPAVLLIILILTNDVHGWAFALDFHDGFSYEHRAVTAMRRSPENSAYRRASSKIMWRICSTKRASAPARSWPSGHGNRDWSSSIRPPTTSENTDQSRNTGAATVRRPPFFVLKISVAGGAEWHSRKARVLCYTIGTRHP